MFEVIMGKPEVEAYWNDLTRKVKDGTATKDEVKTAKKLLKTFKMLGNNPRHPGLNTHEIDSLSRRYGVKVWESYVENNTPGAGRIFWAYGAGRGQITVVSIEPHPNDGKSIAYEKITLSAMGTMDIESE